MNNGGKNWTAEFVGVITRRDIVKLNRIISVEFAKHERRRSVSKIMKRSIKTTPTEETPNVSENPDHKERIPNDD